MGNSSSVASEDNLEDIKALRKQIQALLKKNKKLSDQNEVLIKQNERFRVRDDRKSAQIRYLLSLYQPRSRAVITYITYILVMVRSIYIIAFSNFLLGGNKLLAKIQKWRIRDKQLRLL